MTDNTRKTNMSNFDVLNEEEYEYYHFGIIMIAQAKTGSKRASEMVAYITTHETELKGELIELTKLCNSERVTIDDLKGQIDLKYPAQPASVPVVEAIHSTGNTARDAAIKQIVDHPIPRFFLDDLLSIMLELALLGQLAVIKSVRDEDPDEALMGIYVGSVPFVGPNPVFFVPKLKKTLAGYESWWQPIPKADEQLSCDAMRAKYHFTWADIEKSIEEQLKQFGLKDVSVKVKE